MRVSLLPLFVLTVAPAFAGDKPEPKYEGKPLAYWVAQFQKGDTAEQRAPAAEALKAFGPDAAPALPTFIEMLADRSPAYRSQVLVIVAAIGPAAKAARPAVLNALRSKPAFDFGHDRFALNALLAISPEPKDVVSALAPLLEDQRLGGGVYEQLCAIGPPAKDALPALRRYVLSKVAQGITEPVRTLASVGPDVVPLLLELLDAHQGRARYEALRCLEALGPKAASAGPALQKLLAHDDPHTRYRAAVLLWACNNSSDGVPVLAELLTQLPTRVEKERYTVSRHFSAHDAVQTLSEIGPKARAALPELRRLVSTGFAVGIVAGVGLSSPEGARALATNYRVNSDGSLTPRTPYHELMELGRAADAAIAKIEQKPNP
ncbi:HEAT repeat domain-containing protein [Gemmata sp. JC717]|uniref:HEAT repeat domain-containing protein n=1 Tax=Gemmata algarum TaxID=2975278 RepID=UPI0021BA3C37|nr:HEAT repeat domain-containing protein [Gemmata algarum]MDY3554171.1 HEAT repeat domain-containing protein [Gemmata algarum]